MDSCIISLISIDSIASSQLLSEWSYFASWLAHGLVRLVRCMIFYVMYTGRISCNIRISLYTTQCMRYMYIYHTLHVQHRLLAAVPTDLGRLCFALPHTTPSPLLDAVGPHATPHSPPVPAFPRDSVLLSMLPPSIHSCAAQAVLRMSRCGVLQQRMSEGGLANAQVRPRSRLSHTIYARCLARKIRVDCLVENCAASLARSPRIMPTPALTTRCARSASNPPSST